LPACFAAALEFALAAIPISFNGFFACSALNPGGGPVGGPGLCVSVDTPRR
jgi:hypothetical protein